MHPVSLTLSLIAPTNKTYGEKYGIRLENCEGLRVTVTFPTQTEEPLEEY